MKASQALGHASEEMIQVLGDVHHYSVPLTTMAAYNFEEDTRR